MNADALRKPGPISRSWAFRWGLLGLVMLLVGLPAIYNPMAAFDEAWYAGVSRNILHTGDWWTLYHNGKPFWEKPPLIFWMTSAVYEIFGVSDWASRVVSVSFGLACVLMVYQAGRSEKGPLFGFLCAALLLSAQDFLRFSAKGQLDIPLTFFLTGQMLFFWRARSNPVFHLWAGVCCGLAIATKNQAGVLGYMAQALFMVLAWDFRSLKQWQFYVGGVLALAVASPWFVHQYVMHGQAFVDHFLWINGGKYAEAAAQNAQAGGVDYFFYLRYLLRRHVVLLTFLIYGVGWACYRFWKEGDRQGIFYSAWALTPLLVFSACGATHYWYLIPMYPAVALLSAHALSETLMWNRWPKYSAWAVVAFAVINLACYYIPPPKQHDLWAAKELGGAVQEISDEQTPVIMLAHPRKGHHEEILHRPVSHYYFDRVVVRTRNPHLLRREVRRHGQAIFVSHRDLFEKYYRDKMDRLSVQVVAERRSYVLMRATAKPEVKSVPLLAEQGKSRPR